MPANASRVAPVLAVAFLVSSLLGGCGERQPDHKPNKTQERVKEDTGLMADLQRAGPELERRLAENVSVDDGLLLVKDPAGIGLSVLPVSTPWTLERGIIGMWIDFGSTISGDGSGVTNDVSVVLSHGSIDQKNCAVLGPQIGKRLQVILGTNKR